MATASIAQYRPMALVDANLSNVHRQKPSASTSNRMPPPPSPLSNPKFMRTNGDEVIETEVAPRPSSIPKALHLGMFEIGKPLGKGKFGRVYLVRHRPSGFICALKTLDKSEIIREKAEIHIRREIEVHSNLRHPGVVTFHTWFHDSKRIFLVLEYAAGGELFRYLQKEGKFHESRAANYAAQVASALRYLHSKKVMHRDIKPENILVGLHGELKLADFGYSVYSPSDLRKTMCGTLDYLPPEIVDPQTKMYGKAVDQWTLGVLTYELLMGYAPFEDSMAMTTRRILRCDMKPLPSSVSPEAQDFIHSLLVLDPTKRMSFDDALVHPWILKYCQRH